MCRDGKFFRGVFSEESGLPSFGRLLSAVHGLAGIAWLSVFVWSHKAVPDPVVLAGVLAYVLGPYTVNKTAVIFNGNKEVQKVEASDGK